MAVDADIKRLNKRSVENQNNNSGYKERSAKALELMADTLIQMVEEQRYLRNTLDNLRNKLELLAGKF